jgi:magnesium chelatase family protein
MIAKVYSASLVGLDCQIVDVEVDYRHGLSHFAIVGLPDKAVQEAKERIISAVRNSGAEYIPKRVIVNLAPASLQKSGSAYDLAIAVGFLLCTGQVNFKVEGKLFLGELALDGTLKSADGILPLVAGAAEAGFREVFLPLENAAEAALVPGIKVLPVWSLVQLIAYFHGETDLAEFTPEDDHHQEENSVNSFDLASVRGQVQAKRALEIAAAGGHNLLLSGVPGSGKTLLAKCMSSILPDMLWEESLEVTKIHSIAGRLSRRAPLITQRPVRMPHHTCSQVALVGGGATPHPGEVSLAHRGVLFLDEFPEFSRPALEALRQPLEDKVVTISRAASSLTFPANFILIAAMNPCPCGFLGDPTKDCKCTSMEINRYRKKISGPILDRIDLLVNIVKIDYDKLFSGKIVESSAVVRERVQQARNIQLERFHARGLFTNAEMQTEDIKAFVHLDQETKTFLQNAARKFGLSPRAYFRLLRVARTIADLESTEAVLFRHVAEALSYRIEMPS